MDGAGKSAKDLLTIGTLEAMGTAILLLAINFSGGNACVAVTGILTGAVLSGKLTGAHFNMALSLAVYIVEDEKKKKSNLPLLFVLIISQLLGALFGQWISYFYLGDGIAMMGPLADLNVSAWRVFWIETLFTFILMSSIVHGMFPQLSIQSDMVLAVASGCVSLYFAI